MIMKKPLWDQDVFGAIWVHLQEPEVVFIVFHILAHKTLIAPGNQEDVALAWV